MSEPANDKEQEGVDVAGNNTYLLYRWISCRPEDMTFTAMGIRNEHTASPRNAP